LVDPAVSRAKFDREVARYRKLEEEHTRRGWFLIKAEYPEVFVVFGAPQLRPPALVFGVLIYFTDYDLWPPSVKLVDPFTREPYRDKDLPYRLLRQPAMPNDPALAEQIQLVQPQDLMVAYDPEDVPFLCMPGVREYHEHPAHSGIRGCSTKTAGRARSTFCWRRFTGTVYNRFRITAYPSW